MRVIVFTAADAKYFPLLRGAVQSIHSACPEFEIAVIDLGMDREQLAWCQRYAVRILEAAWPFAGPPIQGMPHCYLGLFCRPKMRDLSPGYDVYVWFDADAWAQDRSGLDLLVAGAMRRKGLAAAPEIDRCNQRFYGGWKQFCENIKPRWAVFGRDVADTIAYYPMLNSGICALHADAPHWQPWSDAIEEGLEVACHFLVEQMALNYVVFLRGLFDKTELMPMRCNWMCHHALPSWDDTTQSLVEPYLPNTKIGNVHLTFRDKVAKRTLQTTGLNKIEMDLRYADGAAV